MATNSRKAEDTHHLCWPRKRWNKGWARLLRYHWYMRVEIPKNTLHQDIHNKVSGIPLPEEKEIKRAIKHLDVLAEAGAISEKDTIEKRLAIVIPMFSNRSSGAFVGALSQQFSVVGDFYHHKNRSRRKQ